MDKRRITRTRVELPARYASADASFEGTVTDISPDGCFFRTDLLDGAEARTRAEIRVDVPSEGIELQLRGEVRWIRESGIVTGMGIRLVDVSLADRLLLSALISQANERSALVAQHERAGHAVLSG